MAKILQNNTRYTQSIYIQLNAWHAYSKAVQPGFNVTLSDEEYRSLVGFKANDWTVTTVADETIDSEAEVQGIVDTAIAASSFVSIEQTGTGAAQNIPHGLSAAPTKVIVAVTDDTAVDGAGGYSIVEGAHDGTNVIVTVTAGVKFKVLAML